MKRPFCCIYILYLLINSTFAQTKTSITGNFDKDSKEDKVLIEESEGSSATFFHIVCNFSTQSYPFSFDCEYSFSEFLFACPIPDFVVHRQEFADKLAKKLVSRVSAHMDSSAMGWLSDICAASNYKSDSLTNYRSTFSVHWVNGMPDLSLPSYAIVNTDATRCLLQNIYADKPVYKSANTIIFYMGNNHKKMNKTIDAPGYKVQLTDHGALLKKGDSYAWVFINEVGIFKTGNEKLRWPSIRDAQVSGHYLIIKTEAMPSEEKSIYVIDLEVGKVARLKNDRVDEALALIKRGTF